MMGMHGDAGANHAIQESDLILACGMRFDDRVTGSLKTFATGAKKIHIDLDPAEINKNIRVDLPLIGDVRGNPVQNFGGCGTRDSHRMDGKSGNLER